MKIKVPEPLNPITLYELTLQNRTYSKPHLKSLLRAIEKSLDKVCEIDLQKPDYTIAEYQVLILETDPEKYLGDYIRGGFDLSIKDTRKHSIKEFQEQYKESFKEISQLQNIQYPINISVCIIGFRDKITTELESPF
ncbi:hypothetical protein HOE04_00590 [archaeon]|jgi:hypothetical protein|nr:hypothetical protein [archaeon]